MSKKKISIEIDEKTYDTIKLMYEAEKAASLNSFNSFEEFLANVIEKIFSSTKPPKNFSKEGIKEMFETILKDNPSLEGGFDDLFDMLFPNNKTTKKKEEKENDNIDISKLKN